MKPFARHYKTRMSGFSLIELMVGVTVGLVSLLSIMQVLSTFEDQKRSTTAGSEAQENGLIALTQLEQDIHNAGAGISDSTLLGCTTTNTYTSATGNPILNFSTAPLSIVAGGTNATPDSIAIRTGSSLVAGIPATLTGGNPTSSEASVSNTSLFNDGDLTMTMNSAGVCTLQIVTQVQPNAGKIQHNPGSSGPYNPPGGWTSYATGDKIVSLGKITTKTYSIAATTNALQVVENVFSATPTSVTQVIGKDIVQMKAQYGIAAAGTQNVNQWKSATGAWASPTGTDIKRIKAIRLVIVARSGKKESTNVTSTCTYAGSGGVNNGPCAWQVDTVADPAPIIDLSSDANWRKYRYKVYQTIIPLRNVIWANV